MHGVILPSGSIIPNLRKTDKREEKRRNAKHIKTQSVIAATCPSYKVSYIIEKGSVNADIFVAFLKSLTFPEKTVILLDNVAFHHSYKVKDVIKEKNWDLLFIPPYSPIFNPIEGVFSIVKRSYQQHMSITRAFESVTDPHILGFFHGSFAAYHRMGQRNAQERPFVKVT